MKATMEALVKAAEENNAAGRAAWSVIVSGDGTFNLIADRLNRATVETDAAISAAREKVKGVRPVKQIEHGGLIFIYCGACEWPLNTSQATLFNYCPNCGVLIDRSPIIKE